jgi:hypothetical protein
MWAMLAFLAFVTAGSVAYLLFERTKPFEQTKPIAASQSKSDPALGLSVSEGQREVTVRWDRHSRQLGSAIKAIVEIQEGSFQKSVPLDRDQLHTGSIVYSRPVAVSDTITFRMRVFFEQDPPVSESVQLVSNLPVPPASPLPDPDPERKTPIETAKVVAPKPEVPAKTQIRIEPPPGGMAPSTETNRPEAPSGETAPTLARPAPRRIP